MSASPCLRFVPARVQGLPETQEVAVYSDRLELNCAGSWVVFPFRHMSHWPVPRWLLLSYRWVRSKIHKRLTPVGEREFCREDRYFRFWTRPPIVVFTPHDLDGRQAANLFQRLHEIMRAGGFATFDLS